MPLFSLIGAWPSSPGRERSTALAGGCSAWRSGASARTSWHMPAWSRPTWPRRRSACWRRISFWLYLKQPTWARASLAGVCLGLAATDQVQPALALRHLAVLWLVHVVLVAASEERWGGWRRRSWAGRMGRRVERRGDRPRLRLRRGGPPSGRLRVRQRPLHARAAGGLFPAEAGEPG